MKKSPGKNEPLLIDDNDVIEELSFLREGDDDQEGAGDISPVNPPYRMLTDDEMPPGVL